MEQASQSTWYITIPVALSLIASMGKFQKNYNLNDIFAISYCLKFQILPLN